MASLSSTQVVCSQVSESAVSLPSLLPSSQNALPRRYAVVSRVYSKSWLPSVLCFPTSSTVSFSSFPFVRRTLPEASTVDAIGLHVPTGVNVWRIPFGLQLVPAGIMTFGLLTVKVSSSSFLFIKACGQSDPTGIPEVARIRRKARRSSQDPGLPPPYLQHRCRHCR